METKFPERVQTARSNVSEVERGSAGATQVLITFDSGFQSCSARVVTGKASGAQSTRTTSIITGAEVEIFSVKTSGESCRVQTGNVFGNLCRMHGHRSRTSVRRHEPASIPRPPAVW